MPQGKQDVGLGDYQVRGWRGGRHHMTLVMMAMLFLLEERQLHPQPRPLLSSRDIRALLNHFLPRRDTTLVEVLRQMEVRCPVPTTPALRATPPWLRKGNSIAGIGLLYARR